MTIRSTALRTLEVFNLERFAARVLSRLRQSSEERRRNAELRAQSELPLPPDELIFLIGGHRDVAEFLESGRRIRQDIDRALAAAGLKLEGFSSVLDFGCGCGRVLRHFREHPGLSGSDYNPKLIRWASRNLPFARFDVNGLAPPLRYADGSFDFIYARSVFTHLPETLGLAWMAELRRVLRPGGYLLFTTHGDNPLYVRTFSPEEARAFSSAEFFVRNEIRPGANRCAAFHPAAYVRARMLEGFDEVSHEGGGAGTDQDIWLVRRQ